MKRTDLAKKRWILFFSALLLPACILASPSAHALGIAVSQAELDWSGLTFTTSSGLIVNRIDNGIFYSSSGASTILGGHSEDFKNSPSNPLDWSFTAAASSYSNPSGYANAQASTTNGLLMAHSKAESTIQASGIHKGEANASTSKSFWLYGRGSGSLTVSAPYTLSAYFNEAQPEGTSNIYDFTTGSASVSLMMGPGAGWYASEALSWPGSAPAPTGNLSKTGILNLSREFNNPDWGPLVGIWATAGTSAVAAVVPEPSSIILVVFGLIGCVAVRKKFGGCST